MHHNKGQILIRKAKKSDAKRAISLLALAMDHFIYKLSGHEDERMALSCLEGFFVREGNRLSYENVCVFEEAGEILGALCFYDGAMAEALDAPLRENLRALGKKDSILRECGEEFYLDSIAVDERARGRGIARALILHAHSAAQKAGKKLSLIVEEDNAAAKTAYAKMGFKFKAFKDFHGHRYACMEI